MGTHIGILKTLLLAAVLMSSCQKQPADDERRECSEQSSRLYTFDYATLVCGPQVKKFSVFYREVDLWSNEESLECLAGDSTILYVPDTYRPKVDSMARINAYWDSVEAIGTFYNIKQRYWGPAPGREPQTVGYYTLYAQFSSGATNAPISAALSPVSSISEAFLIAEKELQGYWIIESSDDLGQGITKTSDGYTMRLSHFERKCPDQVLGLVEVLCKSSGELEVRGNQKSVQSFMCNCWPESLP